MKLLPTLTAPLLIWAATACGQSVSKATSERSAYNISQLLTEPDPVLGNARFTFSKQLQGLKGTDGIIYWLSPDQQSVTAYRNNKVLWSTNIAAALPAKAAGPRTVQQMAWSSNALFFTVMPTGFVELNRQTGQVNQAGTD